ncbi:DUF2059 domain-containing protein [Rhizobium sp. L1K21]|uniref:DUF2059 domain-containing protein n=1 Tax=Rhizobium sp. L1K21 TaxID=2954933 RepID=UPI0020923285|nr:DUF2059 domain-containing protein [Rhizobium sp. L1K21]MCO6186329.1 DUF2059 domain-containing protein [Rhizobium sp. L1K21]
MIKLADIGRFVILSTVVAGVGFASIARAEDITPEQEKAARAALDALNATEPFDNILPQIAERLKANFIQTSPNQQDVIVSTVDENALALAGRRGDLEKEAAAIYARTFTVEELNAITAFFSSDVGQKFLKDVPLANREMYKAADIWGAGIERDLVNESEKELRKYLQPQEGDAAATDGAAAADGAATDGQNTGN